MPGNRFTTELAVRFRDLDAMGHVNNANYFTYFEEARKEFCRHLFHSTSPDDFPFILGAVSCRFERPILLADSPVAVTVRVAGIGRKSFTFQYEIRRPAAPSRLFATGESVQVYYDYARGCSCEIPAAFKAELARYLVG